MTPTAFASATSDDWINALASRLAHLRDANEATIWEAIPSIFPDVMGKPCDKTNGYHIAISAAVVDAVQRG